MKAHAPSTSHSTFKDILYTVIFAIAFPLLFLFTGLALDYQLGDHHNAPGILNFLLGFFIGIAGIYLLASASYELFHTGRGLPLSSSPPDQLVNTGPYRWSRHPVYLGGLLLFAGITLWLATFWGLVLSLPMLAIFYFTYARGIEEPVLIQRYGTAYQDYRKIVPFLFPYPFRNIIHQVFHSVFDRVSALVNRPKMFRIGNHLFFWGYGIWPGIGVMLGLGIMEYILLVQEIPGYMVAGLIIVFTVSGLFSVRIIWRLVTTIRKHLSYHFTAKEVGFMSWGVILTLAVTLILFYIFTPYSLCYPLDAALPGILMAHFWGRIGCVFYGCCYGKQTYSNCGLHYHHPVMKVIRLEQVPEKSVIPVQLFSSFYGLAGSILILGLWWHHALPAGVSAALTAIWYGAFRIDEEWMREQTVVWLDFISPAQIVSFILIITGLTWLLVGSPEKLALYQPLIKGQPAGAIFREMHFLLLIGSGLLTTLVFSYHYKQIGKWQ